MADSFKLYTFDVTKLLTDHNEQIDENDEDFKSILKCLGKAPDNFEQHGLNSLENNESNKACKAIASKCKTNGSIGCQECNQNHIFSYQAYPDYSQIPDDTLPSNNRKNMSGRSQETFPTKFFKILERSGICGYSSIVSWLPHGRAFKIHNQKLFEELIMKKYFFQTKFESFKRQLYVYGFKKIGRRFDSNGAYYHELFIHGRPGLCRQITRWNGKSTSPNFTSPNFYCMPNIMTDSSKWESSDAEIGDFDRLSEPKAVQYIVLKNHNDHEY